MFSFSTIASLALLSASYLPVSSVIGAAHTTPSLSIPTYQLLESIAYPGYCLTTSANDGSKNYINGAPEPAAFKGRADCQFVLLARCNDGDYQQHFQYFGNGIPQTNAVHFENKVGLNLNLYNNDVSPGNVVIGFAQYYKDNSGEWFFSDITETAKDGTNVIQIRFSNSANASNGGNMCLTVSSDHTQNANIQTCTSAKDQTFAVAPVSKSTTALVFGDPQFNGFAGQSYQVHGTSNTVYNIISTPNLQYNAFFSYLESGSCRKDTACFSHPGNYFGQVGLSLKNNDNEVSQLLIQAGPVADGFSSVTINNSTLVGATQFGDFKIELVTPFELVIDSDEFSFRIQNSDYFLNQDVSIGTKLMKSIIDYKKAVKNGESDAAAEKKSKLAHGILGQTWSTQVYPNRWKHIEGQLFDYIVQDGISGKEFKYNRF